MEFMLASHTSAIAFYQQRDVADRHKIIFFLIPPVVEFGRAWCKPGVSCQPHGSRQAEGGIEANTRPFLNSLISSMWALSRG